ncbi:MAG: GTP cyclohydrolase I FolE [Leucobacter sp.]
MSNEAPSGVDRGGVARAVRDLLDAIGVDPDSAELEKTPQRVADMYGELFAGIGQDAAAHLADSVPVDEETGELVLLRGIELRSICEHHLLPFRGSAHLAYVPNQKVVGLSALPRVVETLAARPQVQERLGEQIADTLDSMLSPAGVLVVLEASHGCVADRGVMQRHAVTVTVASRGVLAGAMERAEIMALIGGAGAARHE